jgi:hypothetical protein
MLLRIFGEMDCFALVWPLEFLCSERGVYLVSGELGEELPIAGIAEYRLELELGEGSIAGIAEYRLEELSASVGSGPIADDVVRNAIAEEERCKEVCFSMIGSRFPGPSPRPTGL